MVATNKGGEKRMVRARIEIKRIENITARQVTFSKRRRGLFKKAHELSTLCDAEIAVLVFSSTNKFHDFSSSSTTQVIQRYMKHIGKQNKLQLPSSMTTTQAGEDDCAFLRKEVAERSREVRQMVGEDLDGLSIEELTQLERQMGKAYSRVRRLKDDRIDKLISGLKRKEERLAESNGRLRQKMSKFQEVQIHSSREQLGLATPELQTISNVSFDTSLTLRLGFV